MAIRDAIYSLFQPGGAVTVFFVISGHVLSLSLQRHGGLLRSFIPRRMVRLYPVAMVSVLVGYLYVTMVPTVRLDGASHWFNVQLFPLYPSADSFVANLFMLSWDYNGVLWSIYVEATAAFVLPALLMVRMRAPPLLQAAVFCILLVFHFTQSWLWLRYLYCFYLGLYVGSLGRYATRPLFILAIAGYLATEYLRLKGLVPLDVQSALCVLFGFVILSHLVHYASFRSRWMEWLGNISFSYYAIHLLIMHATTLLIVPHIVEPGQGANALVALVSCTAAIPLAWVLHRLVERPSIHAGRSLARRMELRIAT